MSRYVEMLVATEIDRCQMFERGLRQEILTPVTSRTKWTDFSELVETTLRVEQSFLKESQHQNQVKGFHQLVIPKDGSNDNLFLVYRVEGTLKLDRVKRPTGKLVKEVLPFQDNQTEQERCLNQDRNQEQVTEQDLYVKTVEDNDIWECV